MKRRSLIRSFRYAFEGIFDVINTQRNMKIHIVIATAVALITLALNLSEMETLFVLLAIFLVLISETINTMVESLADLLYSKPNVKVKVIKDVSAGVVLFAAFFAVGVGLIVFGKYIFMNWNSKLILWMFAILFLTLLGLAFTFRRIGNEKRDKSSNSR